MPAPDLSSHKVTAGETSSATKFDNLVQAIQDALAAIGADQLTGYPNDGTKVLFGDGTWNAPGAIAAPTGTVVAFAGAAAPSGWALCDGSAVSRTTFSALFTAIGTTYGAGDGSTTFNLPDLRGRVVVGLSPGGKSVVDTLGGNDGRAQNVRTISHYHNVGKSTLNSGDTMSFHGGGGSETTFRSSGDVDNADFPAFLVLNYIIKT